MAGRSVRGEEPDPTPTAAAETMASGLTPPARLEERPGGGGIGSGRVGLSRRLMSRLLVEPIRRAIFCLGKNCRVNS